MTAKVKTKNFPSQNSNFVPDPYRYRSPKVDGRWPLELILGMGRFTFSLTLNERVSFTFNLSDYADGMRERKFLFSSSLL